MNELDQITVREGYIAMFRYLERVWTLTGEGELGALLGSMSLLPDGDSADPGAWRDWLKAVAAVKAGSTDIDLNLGR